MYGLTITKHGKKRIRERVKIGKSDKKIQRMACLAFERGTKRSEVMGELLKYMDGQYLSHDCGDNMRIWNGKLWVFENHKLITVKGLPASLRHNVKRYARK